MSFGYQDVQEAYDRIKPYLKDTPLEPSFYLGDGARKYFFKLESSSALTVAACMDYPERIGGNNIALVLSGGNIDGDLLTELMNKYA